MATRCLPCDLGAYCVPGSPAPLTCAKGRYGNGTNLQAATDCMPCPKGSACSTGSALPQICEAGTYAVAGSGVCTRCPAGSFQPQAGEASCSACPPGSACIEGADTPMACAAGSVATGIGSATCGRCAAGSYQPEANRVACLPCSLGAHCSLGASAALLCGSGTYGNSTNLARATDCATCPEGHACATGSAVPVVCQPGSVATEGSGVCTRCPAGRFNRWRARQSASGLLQAPRVRKGRRNRLPVRPAPWLRLQAKLFAPAVGWDLSSLSVARPRASLARLEPVRCLGSNPGRADPKPMHRPAHET